MQDLTLCARRRLPLAAVCLLVLFAGLTMAAASSAEPFCDSTHGGLEKLSNDLWQLAVGRKAWQLEIERLEERLFDPGIERPRPVDLMSYVQMMPHVRHYERNNVLNKWNRSIIVAMPPDNAVRPFAMNAIGNLAAITGLRIKLLGVGADRQADITVAYYGNAQERSDERLCLGMACNTDELIPNWQYKMGFPHRLYVGVPDPYGSWRELTEAAKSNFLAESVWLRDAIPFTPDHAVQVEGYLIANEDGTLESAECFIWGGHEITRRRELLVECLVRALGMPNVDTGSAAGLLSARENADISLGESLSPREEILLRALYATEVRSGATKEQVSKALGAVIEKLCTMRNK